LAKGDFVGNEGTTIEAEYALKDVNPDEFDAVIFVGGPGMTKELDNEELHALARRFDESGKLLTAICIAPSMLANAGVLKGKKATVFPTGKGFLISGGAEYTAKQVEKDGLLITADGPESAAAFANEIINHFK
jgi:protease I